MQALFTHYKIDRFSLIFLASCYAALRITEQVVRPTVEQIWQWLTRDEALDLYAYLIVGIRAIAIELGKLALAAGRDARRWVDAFVDSHLEQPTEKLPISDAIAAKGTALLTELFAQADAIMSSSIDADVSTTLAVVEPQVFPLAQEMMLNLHLPRRKRSRRKHRAA